MGQGREFARRYRLPALAIAVSAALHAAVFVGIPKRYDKIDSGNDVVYTATLDPMAVTPAAPEAAPVPAPRPQVKRPRPKPRPKPVVEPLDTEALAAIETPMSPVDAAVPPEMAQVPEIEKPEVLAMAQPAVPIEEPKPEPPKFRPDALPENLSITYALTSAFADGRAQYDWTRDGESYTIHGEAQAEGFFTLFLEGRIVQESHGTVTPTGLRPERFMEKRPNADEEGLEFDWAKHEVTFERGEKKKTTSFTGDTVDWLSMIFQLAHMPPKGDSMELAVFTQRRFYSFKLKVLGVEEIDIPMGRVQALHLRHVDPENPKEVVDVWLGVNQHNLPVKMRYPVAKNRLMVEQSATRVTTR